MKTDNNMQRTIENIQNGLESELPPVARRDAGGGADAQGSTLTNRRKLLALRTRLEPTRAVLPLCPTMCRA